MTRVSQVHMAATHEIAIIHQALPSLQESLALERTAGRNGRVALLEFLKVMAGFQGEASLTFALNRRRLITSQEGGTYFNQLIEGTIGDNKELAVECMNAEVYYRLFGERDARQYPLGTAYLGAPRVAIVLPGQERLLKEKKSIAICTTTPLGQPLKATFDQHNVKYVLDQPRLGNRPMSGAHFQIPINT